LNGCGTNWLSTKTVFPQLARTVLERQGNEVAESAFGQGVLIGERRSYDPMLS
jgi:hypothetical protein